MSKSVRSPTFPYLVATVVVSLGVYALALAGDAPDEFSARERTQSSGAPAVDAAYPHEPPGMTQVLRADGTSVDIPELYENPGWLEYVRVVADPTNPAGTGSVLEGVTPPGRPAFGIAENARFSAGPKAEWYVMLRVFYDPNYENHGHKLFYLGMSGAQATMYLTREPDGRSRFLTQNVSSRVLAQTGPGAMTFGRWHEVELHLVAESAAGRGDGSLAMWFDGRPIGRVGNVQWSHPGASRLFDGMHFWFQSNDANTRRDYVRIGELYISGK